MGKKEKSIGGVEKAPLLPSNRLLLAVFVMFGVMFLYLLRVILSISMICMIKRPQPFNCSELTSAENITIPPHCNNTSNLTGVILDETASDGDRGEFDWSRPFQGQILSSYFYGYLSTQILGGYLAGRFGAKHVLGTGVLISVILTIITPEATRLSSYLLIAIRVALGAAGGVFLPCSQSFWGHWAPVFERSILVAISFLGITLGNIMAYLLSPPLCSIEADNGWPFVFYVTGGMGIVYYIAYNLIVFSTPDQHPRIGQREKNYIKESVGSSTIEQRPPVPWFKMLTSPAVWAILTAQTCNTWFLFTAITLPFYMQDVLKYNVKQNGLLLCIPYMIDMVTMPLAGQFADFLRRRKILRTVVVRKVFQTISCVGSATLLTILGFMDYERRYLAVAALSLIYPIQNLCRPGYGVNPQDIAPKFAGEIFGITTTVATVSGIISPIVVGKLTEGKTREDWQMVFFISSAMFLFGGTVFLIFGRGEIQPWAITEKPINGQLLEGIDDEEKKEKQEKNGFKS